MCRRACQINSLLLGCPPDTIGRCRKSHVDPNGLFHIGLSDTGPGIPDELHDKVFEPFDRLGAESSDIPGTGIGLTVTKQLIESMGGTIGFESVVGEGSIFWIELPLASSEAKPVL